VHDPQPLPLISHFADREIPWLWQCHVDLSSPHAPVWAYLRRFIEQYNAAIFSLPEYGQDLQVDQQFVTPAIDPFSAKNRELSDTETRIPAQLQNSDRSSAGDADFQIRSMERSDGGD
jgi:trehalose synthase